MKLLSLSTPSLDLRGRRVAIQLAISAVFLLLLLGHVGGVYRLGFLAQLDAAIYDYKVVTTMPTTIDDRVVIVDIDEKSLKEIGRWPWPREQIATLTNNLFKQYGTAAVAFDIVFAEPDQSSGLPVLERLAAKELADDPGFAATLGTLRPRLDYDARLAEALASGPSVLGYYFSFAKLRHTETVGQLPAPLFACDVIRQQGVEPLVATAYNANLARLQAQAASAAFFNMQADFDGTARRMPMVIEHAGRCYGSLSMLTTLQAMGGEPISVQPAQGLRPLALGLSGLPVPIDGAGMALVPYRTMGAFNYVSAVDVITGHAPAALLEGRAVLVGSTAPGIMDLRVTPVSKAFPGVEIHANLISGILDGRLKWEPVGLRGLEIALTLGLGVLMAVLLPFAAPLRAALVTLLMLGVLLGGDFALWHYLNVSVPIAGVLFAVLGLFVINMSYGFFVEARSKAQMTKLFGQYVPPELVEEMAKDPARYNLRGESRVMTVLFSDIVGFTSISEGLEASELAAMLNAFLSHMTQLIQHSRGTIDKYIGDAIMAFWGAPLSDDLHARDAVLTALAMQATLAELNPKLEAQGWPAVKIGVGVNTGRMSVGNMGSAFRMAYTVMADAVNLASRLEALTRQYGVGVLVGEATREACPDLAFSLVDKVRVKGKALPVAIYEPLGVASEVPAQRQAEAAAFASALEDYHARRWDAAETKLQELRAKQARRLYDIYLERIAHFRSEPPPQDWDGVYTYTTK